jgi:hypothetical protein
MLAKRAVHLDRMVHTNAPIKNLANELVGVLRDRMLPGSVSVNGQMVHIILTQNDVNHMISELRNGE